MNKYEKALEQGYSPEQIMNRIVTRDADRMQKAVDLGYSAEEVFKRYETRFGIPASMFYQEEKKPIREEGSYVPASERIAQSPVTQQIKEEAQSVYDTVKPHFMKGWERTKQEVPNILGGVVEGIGENLVEPVLATPNPFSYFFPEQTAGVIDVAKETTSNIGRDIATDPESVNYQVGKFAGPLAVGGAYDIATSPKVHSVIRNAIKGKSTAKEAYDMLIKKAGSTQKEIDSYFDTYSKAINKPIAKFTDEDKVNAVMSNSEVASKFKMEAEYYSEQVLHKSKLFDESMREIIGSRTVGGDLNNPILQFQQFADESGEIYGEVKDILLKNFNNNVNVSTDMVERLRKTIDGATDTSPNNSAMNNVVKYLEKASKGEGLLVEDLLDLKQNINALNLKSTAAWKAGEVGDSIDALVKNGIGDDGFAIWKDVNKRYAVKKALEEDNPIAKLFMDRKGNSVKSISDSELATKILNLDSKGYTTFNSLRNAIGEDAMERVEKEIVNIALKKGSNLAESLEKIKEFEFSTTQGRSIQSELNRIEGAIPKENINKMILEFTGGKTDSTGWSDNVFRRVRFHLVSKVYNALMRRMPSGSEERAFLTIGDIVKDKKAMDNLKIKTGDAFQEAFKQEQADLKSRIKELAKKGEAKTKFEAEQLEKLKEEAKKTSMQLELFSKKKTREIRLKTEGTIQQEYTGPFSFDDYRSPKETFRPPNEVVEPDEIIPADKPFMIGNDKKAGKDIIDAEVIEKKKFNALTPEQATRSNNLTAKINENMDIIKRRKEGLKSLYRQKGNKAKPTIKRFEEEIRRLEAENITLRKKIPKI